MLYFLVFGDLSEQKLITRWKLLVGHPAQYWKQGTEFDN